MASYSSSNEVKLVVLLLSVLIHIVNGQASFIVTFEVYDSSGNFNLFCCHNSQ